jgi:tyrosyl-tRNA synthetase
MTKVINDKKSVGELLTRGVEKVYPNFSELEKRLLSGDRLRLYCGFDPSAPALHIGNAIALNKLGQFQALGHEVIFLIGDFTGMIGDPTDKKAARRQMTRVEVLANAKDYQTQAAAYLKFDGANPAKVLYNSAWNDKLTYKELIELASNFTVQQMITRDMFQERLKEEKPIYLHEFFYPLTQGYDSVVMDVDLEIGGNDQLFNMLCGRDLLKALKNKEKYVLTLRLLADEGGKKMGKSEGNVVWLNAKPNDMYGQVMSWPDGVICRAFESCTNVPMPEITKMTKQLQADKINPRDLKMKLAYEITRLNAGEEAALAAQTNFIKTIQKKELPEEMATWQADRKEYNILDLLVETDLASSKSEARRLVEQGAIKIKSDDGLIVVEDVSDIVKIDRDIIITRGKFHFIKVLKK